jgi:hypothetical protein
MAMASRCVVLLALGLLCASLVDASPRRPIRDALLKGTCSVTRSQAEELDFAPAVEGCKVRQ